MDQGSPSLVSLHKDGERRMKDVNAMNAREFEAYLNGKVLAYFGNEIQDQTSITSSRGTYHIRLRLGEDSVDFGFKKKSVKSILKRLRALAAA